MNSIIYVYFCTACFMQNVTANKQIFKYKQEFVWVRDRGSYSMSLLKDKTKIIRKDAADESDENIEAIFIFFVIGMPHHSNTAEY